jgi:hypothetical protein
MIGKVYRMFDGNANTMWFLYQNIAKRDCVEDRCQKTDVRRQMSEVRGQSFECGIRNAECGKKEDRGQMSEVRGQRTDIPGSNRPALCTMLYAHNPATRN